MIGQETQSAIPYFPAERMANASERRLWNKAEKLAKKVTLKAYLMQVQWAQIKFTHAFAVKNEVNLGEPDLPDFADRMFAALKEIEDLKKATSGVNNLSLGIRLSENGKDLDIVKPKQETMSLGWILPAVIAGVVVIGIIARWAYLESEVSEITAKYNGVIKRADIALCEHDPNSPICKDWKKAKAVGDYYKRESIIDSVKNAVKTVGGVAKKGVGYGIALAIPLLIFMYAPRRKEK